MTWNNFYCTEQQYLYLILDLIFFYQPAGGVLLERKDPERYAKHTINGQAAFNALDREIRN